MLKQAYAELAEDCRRKIEAANRSAAAKIYTDYREPFLKTIEGALTKDLLIRDEDVQVLYGFDSVKHAQLYLSSKTTCLSVSSRSGALIPM